jgi:2-methylisocitrate lyase-like PEP mutase family enzyme
VLPKKCGHLDNKQLIPLDDHLIKIRAAAEAKTDKDFLIIARTDSRAVLDFEEAVRRSNAAPAAGADMIFLEAPQTMEEVPSVPRLVKGPCLLNVVRGGKTPDVDLKEVRKAGDKIPMVPGLLMMAAVGIREQMLGELESSERRPKPPGALNVRQRVSRFGADERDPLRDRYGKLAIAKAAEQSAAARCCQRRRCSRR